MIDYEVIELDESESSQVNGGMRLDPFDPGINVEDQRVPRGYDFRVFRRPAYNPF